MSIYFADDTVTLHHGDALAVLAGMPDGSVDCIVTSPPYLGLRDYGDVGTDWPAATYAPIHGLPEVEVPAMRCALGLEPTPAAYIAHLVLIFRECRRVLADDGTLWLNLGDSYARQGGAGRGGGSMLQGRKHGHAQEPKSHRRRKPGITMPEKNLLGIPWQAALALQADDSGDTYEMLADAPRAVYNEICLIRTRKHDASITANTLASGAPSTPSDTASGDKHGMRPTPKSCAATAESTTSSTESKKSSEKCAGTLADTGSSDSTHSSDTAGPTQSVPAVESGVFPSSHSTTSAEAEAHTGGNSKREASTSGSSCAARTTQTDTESSVITAIVRSGITVPARTKKSEPLRLQKAEIPPELLPYFRLVKQDRWILRNDVIWSKSNGMPESVRDRLTAKHEHIFLFAKSPKYHFNLAPIREPHESTPDRAGGTALRGQKAIRASGPNSGSYSEGGRNPGDVWTIATQPFTGAPRSVRPNPDPRGPDAPAYGKERIASADCSQHGSQGLPDSTPSHGGREVAYEIRTSGNSDHPGLVPAGGSESTETNRELSTQPSSSDSPHPPCGPSATPHSTESRRTDPAPSTSQPCTPSAQTTLHTERIEGSLDFDVPATSTHESSNGAPERRGAGARTRPRTPDMCTCSWVDNTPSTSHFAVFPPALAEKCILAGCKPGGTVLDPFSGAGTTGMVAARHGRRYVGIDASRDFLDMSLRTRLAQGALIEEAGA